MIIEISLILLFISGLFIFFEEKLINIRNKFFDKLLK